MALRCTLAMGGVPGMGIAPKASDHGVKLAVEVPAHVKVHVLSFQKKPKEDERSRQSECSPWAYGLMYPKNQLRLKSLSESRDRLAILGCMSCT